MQEQNAPKAQILDCARFCATSATRLTEAWTSLAQSKKEAAARPIEA